MIVNVICSACNGPCERVGTNRWTCPACAVMGPLAVCGRCAGVVPAGLVTTWHGEGYAEAVCYPCVRDASIGVLDCAG